jgi:hypothetical protein
VDAGAGGGDAVGLTVPGDYTGGSVVTGVENGSISIGGSLLGALPVTGGLASLTVNGNLAGPVTVGGNVGAVSVGGNLTGTVTVRGGVGPISVGGTLAAKVTGERATSARSRPAA